MDPRHRDRIAFMRICSGTYRKGIKLKQVRTGKDVRIPDALTFLAGERDNVEEAFSGDIIGLHNHGTIQIGDVAVAIGIAEVQIGPLHLDNNDAHIFGEDRSIRHRDGICTKILTGEVGIDIWCATDAGLGEGPKSNAKAQEGDKERLFHVL